MAISAEALGQRLDVRTPGDLAIDAIASLQSRLPGWIPRNAAPEVVLLEALAELVGGVVDAADVILGGAVESVLDNLHAVPRLPGMGATGDLTVTFDSAVTTTIPAGTTFLLQEWDVELQALEDVSVVSATSATVAVAAVQSTADINGLDSTALVDILDVIPNAIAVEIDGVLGGGAAPEGDEEYLERARHRLSRLSSSLGPADSFTAYALEDGRAYNAVCIPAWDGVDIATAGTDGGHVGVATYGRGAQLSAEVRADLAAQMQDLAVVGVSVHVVEGDVTTVPVTATVAALAGRDVAEVRTNVEEALAAYLSPELWAWGETVRTTTLITVLAAADGVDYVDSLDAPAADVTLEANGLASAGTLTISVI